MKVCRRRRDAGRPQSAARPQSAMAVEVVTADGTTPEVNASSTPRRGEIEPAPTIRLRMLSLNGHADISVLPDSGADVSLAGPSLLCKLNEHPDNLLPSVVSSRAVNGTVMQPISQLPVTFSLGSQSYSDDVYVYPGVRGVILSWKAARGLGILPLSYPYPPRSTCAVATQRESLEHPSRHPQSPDAPPTPLVASTAPVATAPPRNRPHRVASRVYRVTIHTARHCV